MMYLHIRIICYPSLFISVDSTDTPGQTAEGITGWVLLILTEVILLVVFVLGIIFMAVRLCDAGKHVATSVADCNL